MSARERDGVAEFEAQRPLLRGLAYRMLGSRAEAEDAVQDAWLRWSSVDPSEVENPRAFLSRTVTRLCLDRLKSARAQREVYVGTWLPEPLVDEAERYAPPAPSPERESELASDLSFAFLLAMERLSPLERAAFLLHDVFDLDFPEVATALGRSEAACRQLASRARSHVKVGRPRFVLTRREGKRLATAFAGAVREGELAGLARLLASEATFVSDGGGKVSAVPKPVVGRARVAQVILGFVRAWPGAGAIRLRFAWINGLPGFVLATGEGEPIQTVALEFNEAGEIAALYVVRNPDKLAGVTA